MMDLNDIKTNLLVLGAVVGGSEINWIINEITVISIF